MKIAITGKSSSICFELPDPILVEVNAISSHQAPATTYDVITAAKDLIACGHALVECMDYGVGFVWGDKQVAELLLRHLPQNVIADIKKLGEET